MIVIFLLILFIITTSSNWKLDSEKNGLLSKQNSNTINGIFILLVFASHSRSYTTFTSNLDIGLAEGVSFIGQLMVITFFSFSGYGIYNSILSRENYIEEIMPRRLFAFYKKFFIAIIIFLSFNAIFRIDYPLSDKIFAFTGWSSIGNSNWYVFSIIVLYIATMISFKNVSVKKEGVFRLFGFMIFYILVIDNFKLGYWTDTILCFPFGMLLREYEDFILKTIREPLKLIALLFVNAALIIFVYLYCDYSWVSYNFISILFIILIILFNSRLDFSSEMSSNISTYTFEIYMYQRLSFYFFSQILVISNPNLFITVSFLFTLFFSYIVKKLYYKIL